MYNEKVVKLIISPLTINYLQFYKHKKSITDILGLRGSEMDDWGRLECHLSPNDTYNLINKKTIIGRFLSRAYTYYI